MVQAKQAGSRIFDDSGKLLMQAEQLADAYSAKTTGFNLYSLLLIACGATALVLLTLIAKIYRDDIACAAAKRSSNAPAPNTNATTPSRRSSG